MRKTRVLSHLFGVLLACVACLHASSREAFAQLADSAWPMFQHDMRHTGQSTFNGPASANNLKWIYRGLAPLKSAPAIGTDGTIYIGNGRNLCALDPANGGENWCTFVVSSIKLSSPAVGINATVYIGARDNKLHALNTDGSSKFTFHTTGGDGDVSDAPVIGPDGTIYFSGTGRLHALNPDGSLKWVADADGPIFTGSPALGTDGTIYFPTIFGTLYALNPDGSVQWIFKAGKHIRYSAPSIAADGTIYIGTEEALVAVKPDGTLRWKFPTAGRLFSSAAIATDGTIYVGSMGKSSIGPAALYAISPAGTQLWAQTNGASFRGGPAIGADGTIYAASGTEVLAFQSDGTPLWSYSTGARVLASLAIGGDGTLYVSSDDHNLYAFAP
jgi:outer membrane protein assembly factor BamB